jgi:hypothetical protein
MTRLEFEMARMAIEQETFQGTSCEPIAYAIDRNAFLCEKLQRLIALARQTPGETARNRLKQWKGQLERAVAAKQRFEKLRAEIKTNPPIDLFAPYSSKRLAARDTVHQLQPAKA